MPPTAVALLMGSHQDHRFRRGMGGLLEPEVDARTSNVPFAALLMGSQEDSWLGGWTKLGEEVKGLNAVAALALALALQRGRSAGTLLPQIAAAARTSGSRRARAAAKSGSNPGAMLFSKKLD